MENVLYKRLEPKDITFVADQITSADFSVSNYGILRLRLSYATTERNQSPFLLLSKDIKGLEVNSWSSTYSNRLVFKDLIRNDGVRVTFSLTISSSKLEMYRYFDYIQDKKITEFALPIHTDLLFYIKEEYIEANDYYRYSLRVKNGALSTLNNEIFDFEIDSYNIINEYVFGLGIASNSLTSSYQDFYNMQIAYDISNLGGGGQLIDPTLSTKSVSKYIGGQEYRLLTEDMVVDPTKIDISKTLVVDEDAPRVLTEECLSVASTMDTKDHQVHPNINPIIQIDDTCLGCEKLGRD